MKLWFSIEMIFQCKWPSDTNEGRLSPNANAANADAANGKPSNGKPRTP